MEVVLYSTDCPKCKVLKEKLINKNLSFHEVNDTKLMEDKGIIKVPVLEVDNTLMGFVEANEWINNQ